MATKQVALRCMMCGHEYAETVERGVDRERSCPACRSNSIRQLKKKKPVKEEPDVVDGK